MKTARNEWPTNSKLFDLPGEHFGVRFVHRIDVMSAISWEIAEVAGYCPIPLRTIVAIGWTVRHYHDKGTSFKFRCAQSTKISMFKRIIVAMLLSIRIDSSLIAEDLPVEVITVIDAQQKAVNSYKWRFEYLRLTPNADRKPISFQDAQKLLRAEALKQAHEDRNTHSVTGTMLFDATSNRYIIHALEVSQSGDKKPRFEAMGGSFDGESYFSFDGFTIDPEAILNSKEIPPNIKPTLLLSKLDRLHGVIASRAEQVGDVSSYCGTAGLYYFPHFCPQLTAAGSQRVSIAQHRRGEYLSEFAMKHQSAFCSEAPGFIGLMFNVPNGEHVVDGKKVTSIVRPALLFDTSKNGALAWTAVKGPGPIQDSVYATEIISTECAPGVWIPSEIISFDRYSASGFKILISDVELNPEFDESSFRYQFPVGTDVDDVRGEPTE
jgi:hypothetical protein